MSGERSSTEPLNSSLLSALRRAVLIVALLNLAYFGVEFAVALRIGSVSLFADSADFFEDAAVNFLIVAALGWSAARRRARGHVAFGNPAGACNRLLVDAVAQAQRSSSTRRHSPFCHRPRRPAGEPDRGLPARPPSAAGRQSCQGSLAVSTERCPCKRRDHCRWPRDTESSFALAGHHCRHRHRDHESRRGPRSLDGGAGGASAFPSRAVIRDRRIALWAP